MVFAPPAGWVSLGSLAVGWLGWGWAATKTNCLGGLLTHACCTHTSQNFEKHSILHGISCVLWCLPDCLQCRCCRMLRFCGYDLWGGNCWSCASGGSSRMQHSPRCLHGSMRCKIPWRRCRGNSSNWRVDGPHTWHWRRCCFCLVLLRLVQIAASASPADLLTMGCDHKATKSVSWPACSLVSILFANAMAVPPSCCPFGVSLRSLLNQTLKQMSPRRSSPLPAEAGLLPRLLPNYGGFSRSCPPGCCKVLGKDVMEWKVQTNLCI